MQQKPLRAAQLANVLSKEVFDVGDAAKLLGIARNSLEYAAYRRRVPFVQYGAKKFFTRLDLLDYASARGRGRESRLEAAPSFRVK